eukprot:JP448100.1.p2 GENE.JP448100.1~~JP448100.1.p2  ORF type:complete len:114 (+),score=61.15 JP448100.1:25-342(+)
MGKKEAASPAKKGSAKKTAPTKEKKVRAKKDPNAPKRGLSAFMFFSADKRAEVKKEHPDASIGETAKLIGAMWQAIKEKEKKKFEDMAAKDKIRYEKEMAKYNKK